MKFKSLALRLFLTSTAFALIVLLLAAYQLISQYQTTIESNFDKRLKANLSLLIESSLQENFEAPVKPNQIGGFAFTLPNSGWYWQIRSMNETKRPLFSSTSLGNIELDFKGRENLNEEKDGTIKYYVSHQQDRRLRVIERIITLGSEKNPQNYSFIVTGDSSEIDDEVLDFASMLTISFLTLGSGLILATILQVKVGLQPLRVVERGLAAIRAGKTDKLEGEFPAEIEPLQFEINNLIKSNMNIIERARTHVGNLAHALKTPLSVINNEVNGKKDALAAKISEQTDIMQNQISHHLDRARMAARVGVVGSLTEIYPPLKALERVLNRIYQEKGIKFELSCPEDAKFAGEQQDFEEIVGNLLDNAFKWAKSQVHCSIETNTWAENKPQAQKTKQKSRPTPQMLSVIIEDDGPGLSKEEQQEVRKRGKRLDETVPGSGLGLSIVTDLVDLYGGKVELSNAKIGGLRVKIQLPAGT